MATVTKDLVKLYVASDRRRLKQRVCDGKLMAAELTETTLTVIGQINPKLNAVIHRLDRMARA